MPSTVVQLDCYTGEPRTGLWCHACALPSLVELDAVAFWGDGDNGRGGIAGRFIFSACTDCKRSSFRPRRDDWLAGLLADQ